MAGEYFAGTVSVSEFIGKVTLDMGCLRGVAGMPWAIEQIKVCKQENRFYEIRNENERFTFGPSESWQSKHRFGFEACLA